MELRNPLRTAAVLFDGQADGQWTLPDPVLTARDALTRVQGIVEDLPPHPPEHPHTVRDRLAYLVTTGADVDPAPVFDAQRAIGDYEERVALARRAQEIAAQQFTTTLGDHAREIITAHLAPALDELAGNLSRDFAATRHIDGQTPPAVVLSQPKPVRDALIRIDTNVTRYTLVRQAYSVLRRIAQTETQDSRGYFAEIRNTERVWPEITRDGFAPKQPPWPTGDTRTFLAWIFAHDGELWAPTVAQQDARYLEVFGERLRRVSVGRSQLNAYRGMYEGPVPPSSPTPTSGSERRAAIADRIMRAGVPVNGGGAEKE